MVHKDWSDGVVVICCCALAVYHYYNVKELAVERSPCQCLAGATMRMCQYVWTVK